MKLLKFLETAWAEANQVNLLSPLPNQDPAAGSIEDYLKTAFPFFIQVSVALAILMIAWGGLEYILSRVPGAKSEGKGRINQALFGLLIALTAYLILTTINPNIPTTSLTSSAPPAP